MTAKQILKKLSAAGFNISAVVETSRDTVTIGVMDREQEARMDNGFSYTRERATTIAKNKAAKILGRDDAYRTQWGGWVLSAEPHSMDTGNCK